MSEANREPVDRERSEVLKNMLIRTNLIEKKAQIVKDFSATNSEHISDLNNEEAVRCINYLQEMDVRGNNMRMKMLSMGYQMFYDEPLNEEQRKLERKRINFLNVSAWCESDHCKYRKPLNKLDPFELAEVVTQFEKVLTSYNKKASRAHAEK